MHLVPGVGFWFCFQVIIVIKGILFCNEVSEVHTAHHISEKKTAAILSPTSVMCVYGMVLD